MLPSPALHPAFAPSVEDPYRAAWDVVLDRTSRGEAEIQQPLLRLSSAQRQLLAAIDGRRSLQLVVAHQPDLASARLSRDAARLLAFGLVRQVQGELPRALVVAAMNLTLQIPARTAGAWSTPQSALLRTPLTIEEDLPPERWPDIEPDEWEDDGQDGRSATNDVVNTPSVLQVLPYMAATSAATLLLAWLAWR